MGPVCSGWSREPRSAEPVGVQHCDWKINFSFQLNCIPKTQYTIIMFDKYNPLFSEEQNTDKRYNTATQSVNNIMKSMVLWDMHLKRISICSAGISGTTPSHGRQPGLRKQGWSCNALAITPIRRQKDPAHCWLIYLLLKPSLIQNHNLLFNN